MNPVLLSAMLPGMGHLSMGKKALGMLFLISSITFVGLGLFMFIKGYLAYLDLAVNFDPNAALPKPGEVIKIKEMIILFATAIVIHFTSIIHTIHLTKKV